MSNRIEAVNFHITSYCNMKCKFCFATFQDIGKSRLNYRQLVSIIDECAEAGIRKVNFAGGEPTWIKNLPELISYAKSKGLITSVISNGSRFQDIEFMDSILENLDILGVSIDSANVNSHRNMGRFDEKSIDLTSDLRWVDMARAEGCLLKVNTVVSKFNWQEDMSEIIRLINPMRWKVFQALKVDGQNDLTAQDYLISHREFSTFVENHQFNVGDVPMIVEDNDLITGSYLMISPDGRLYDDTKGKHSYSKPILHVGWNQALKEVNVDSEKFDKRDGRYYERL